MVLDLVRKDLKFSAIIIRATHTVYRIDSSLTRADFLDYGHIFMVQQWSDLQKLAFITRMGRPIVDKHAGAATAGVNYHAIVARFVN